MSDIIFARTRFDYINPENGYGSYFDFWRLVQLSGFETCFVDEIDVDRDAVYIYTPHNGETENGFRKSRAKVILWNLEQGCYPPIPGLTETWVSDLTLAKLCDAKYVFMGSHADLVYKPLVPTEREYDVAFLAYITHRRKGLAYALDERGIKRSPTEAWGEARHNILASSSAMLHVHQNDGKPYMPPQRVCLAAAYKLPFISEAFADRGLLSYSNVLTSDYANLAEFTHLWTRRNDWGILRDYGLALHSALCRDYTFKMSVERNV